MKYVIKCPACGDYQVSLDFKPACCPKCGDKAAGVNRFVSEKTKQRVELAKSRMDELKPQITAAHDKYMELMVLYEDECQLLRCYAKRGLIAQEEVDPYLFRKNKDNHKKSLNTLLKEYRAKRAANGEE